AVQPVEHDVLVEPRDHALGELEPARVERVELTPSDLVLPGYDLGKPLDLNEPERGGELAHPEVEAPQLVRRLAVVAVPARVLDHLGPTRHEHAALACRDRLR